MSMDETEREVRRLLEEHGVFDHYSTGHEVWKLSDGSSFPVPAKGRRGTSGRSWLNIRGNLRRKLRSLGIDI